MKIMASAAAACKPRIVHQRKIERSVTQWTRGGQGQLISSSRGMRPSNFNVVSMKARAEKGKGGGARIDVAAAKQVKEKKAKHQPKRAVWK
jgi:type 1 glutamine amidotransferase